MLMGSSTIKNIISKLDADVEFINRNRLSKLTYAGHKKMSRIDRKTAIIAPFTVIALMKLSLVVEFLLLLLARGGETNRMRICFL